MVIGGLWQTRYRTLVNFDLCGLVFYQKSVRGCISNVFGGSGGKWGEEGRLFLHKVGQVPLGGDQREID